MYAGLGPARTFVLLCLLELDLAVVSMRYLRQVLTVLRFVRNVLVGMRRYQIKQEGI